MQFSLLIALVLEFGQSSPRFPWKMDQKVTGTFEGSLHWTLKNPGFEAVEWIAIAPSPPSLSGQKTHSVQLLPGETETYTDDSPLKRAFLRNRIPVKKEEKDSTPDSLKAVWTTQVTLNSRKISPNTSRTPTASTGQQDSLTVAEKKKYLRPSTTIDFDSEEFRRWLKEEKFQRQPGEDDLALAKRIFVMIKTRFSFRADPKATRKASETAQRTEGDFGGLNALFVAMCRSQGIPARPLVGRLAKSTQFVPPRGGGAAIANHQWYIRSEFWHSDLGWVPVDLLASLGPDRSEAQISRWFGSDPGDLIVFHEDFDVKMDPVIFDKKEVLCVEGIAVWSNGKGKLDAQSLTEEWKVRKIAKPKPIAPSRPDSKK